MINLIENSAQFGNKTAVIDQEGNHSYLELYNDAVRVAKHIVQESSKSCHPVCFLFNPGANYIKTKWAIALSGNIATPLCIFHPLEEWDYVVNHSQTELIICDKSYYSQAQEIIKNNPSIKILKLEDLSEDDLNIELPEIKQDNGAMMLYTSGTTNRPKGVITTHNNIDTQVSSLVKAWKWKESDKILHFLPLHHLHGILNKMLCALSVGATVEFIPKFDASIVCDRIEKGGFTLFMAVPTIYKKLTDHILSLNSVKQTKLKAAFQKLRLMISGSAALPIKTLKQWEDISGHYLLERYGMTEIGMGISNPYLGERRAGYIGQALPSVIAELRNEEGNKINEGEGEIHIKGPTVFKEYWKNPEATSESFTEDGFFKTGDIAVIENGYYKILGRSSVDIIKSGGYKISALEIEEAMRKTGLVSDVAVVGVLDDEWGEVVSAAYVSEEELDIPSFKTQLKDLLAAYKVPQSYLKVDDLPRNVMGKVTKKEVKKLFNA